MNMEKLGGKKEAFVPEEKQAEFAQAAAQGKELHKKSEKMENDAKGERTLSKVQAGGAAFLGTLGAAAALTGNPIGAGIGLGTAALYGVDARHSKKKAERLSGEATQAEIESETAYGTSRSIVEEGMRKTGAEEIEDELYATPEQIEIARKEMEEKYGGGEK